MTGRLRLSSPVAGALGFMALVGVWECLARTLLASSYIVPAPSAILRDVVTNFASYSPHITVTAREAMLGYLWGNGLAILLALIVTLLPALEQAFARMALIINCMPLLVLAPILQVVFADETPVVILSAMFVLFTTFISVLVGLRQVDRAMLDVVHVAGGGRMSQLLRIRLNACIPSIAGGLAIAAPGAIAGAMVGEYMGSVRGLGIAMVHAQASFQVERTWGLALLASAMALLAYGAVHLVGNALTPWMRDRMRQMPALADVQPNGGMSLAASALLAASTVALALAGWLAFLQLPGLDPYFAKGPADVWDFLVSGTDAAAHRAAFATPMLVTLGHASVGLVAGFAGALLLGAVTRLWPLLERGFAPYLVIISAIPVAAMIPLFTVVLGRGLGAVTLVVALLTFFPTFVNVMTGLAAAPEQACDVVTVAGGSSARALWMVRLPYSTPWLFASLRISAPNAIGSALVAEWLITGDGMAQVMQTSRNASDYAALWSAGLALVIASILAYSLVALSEHVAMRSWTGQGGVRRAAG